MLSLADSFSNQKVGFIAKKNKLNKYNRILYHLVITLLAASLGNMKQNLCFDWLTEKARWPHLACSGLPTLILHKKKNYLGQIYKVCNFWAILALESKRWQKTVKWRKKGLFRYKNSWLSFPSLEITKSF